jgi:hypothetical protein
MHYETLRGLLESCQLMIGRQVRFEFGDPPDGRELHRGAFFARFPEPADPVAQWDAAVMRVETVDGSVEVAGIRTNVRPAGKELLGEEELRQLVRPLAELCEAAPRVPEVVAVAKAQDDLNQLMPAFTDELKLHLVTEAIVVDEGCPICQRNLAR